jgi:hypothetical protein
VKGYPFLGQEERINFVRRNDLTCRIEKRCGIERDKGEQKGTQEQKERKRER